MASQGKLEAEQRRKLIDQGKELKERLAGMEAHLQTVGDRLQVPVLHPPPPPGVNLMPCAHISALNGCTWHLTRPRGMLRAQSGFIQSQ